MLEPRDRAKAVRFAKVIAPVVVSTDVTPPFEAVVAVVALVAVAAFPEMLIPQVPDAPVPVSDGMSVPIASPRLVRAPDAVEAQIGRAHV